MTLGAQFRDICLEHPRHRIVGAFCVMGSVAAHTRGRIGIISLIQKLSMMARFVEGQLICPQVIPFHFAGVRMASGTEFWDALKRRPADKAIFPGVCFVFVKRFGISTMTIVAGHLALDMDAFLKQSDGLGIFSSQIQMASNTGTLRPFYLLSQTGFASSDKHQYRR
jgi:hypothetical protein